MVMYARILFNENHNNIIEVKGDRNKNHLNNSLLTEYMFKGIFDESEVNRMLEKIKPDEIYIDIYTLSRFTYGFYRKYQNVIKEENYEAN